MANYSTNELKSGVKILLDNEPHVILENEAVKPGKGQAFNRIKVRNLINGRVIEHTLKSGKSIESANVHELELQYLYSDGSEWHFMDAASFQQYTADAKAITDTKNWLKEEAFYKVTLYNEVPLIIEPPNFMELKVTQTDLGVRGDTVGSGNKPAEMETGAVVKVPLFVEEGDILRIDTRTKAYVSRAK